MTDPFPQHECHICGAFASFICGMCGQYMCMSRHRKRRKISGEWSWQCSACTEKIDAARKGVKS